MTTFPEEISGKMATRCCVPHCKGSGGFVFPKDPELNKRWREAIRRLGPGSSLWQPGPHSRVCPGHFQPEDFKDNHDAHAQYHGRMMARTLKSGVVPSICGIYYLIQLQGEHNEIRFEKQRDKNVVKDKPKGDSLRRSPTSDSLDTELEPMHDYKIFSCQYCEKFFSNKKSVQAHEVKAHRISDQYFCQFCKKVFSTKQGLKKHTLAVPKNCEGNKVANLKCPMPMCSKVFSTGVNLKAHLDSAHTKKFSCQFCDQQFTSSKSMNWHRENHHKNQTPKDRTRARQAKQHASNMGAQVERVYIVPAEIINGQAQTAESESDPLALDNEPATCFGIDQLPTISSPLVKTEDVEFT